MFTDGETKAELLIFMGGGGEGWGVEWENISSSIAKYKWLLK